MFWTNLFFNVAFSALFGLGLADQVMETPLVVHQEYDCVCPDGVCPASPAGYACPVGAPGPSLPGPIVPVGYAAQSIPTGPYSVKVCVTGGPRDCAPSSTNLVVLPNTPASLERIGVDEGQKHRQVLQVTVRDAGPGCVEVDLNVTASAENLIVGANTGRTRTTTFRGTQRIPLGRSFQVVLSGSAPEPCTAEVTVAPLAAVPQLVAMPMPQRMPQPLPVPPPSPYYGFVPVSTPALPSPVRTASLLPEPLPLPYPPPYAVTCPTVCPQTCAATCPKACVKVGQETCGKGCQKACATACAKECGKCCQQACAATCSKECAKACATACAKECGKCCQQACAAACSKECAKVCQEACAKCCQQACAAACSKECAKCCQQACAATCSKACAKTCAKTCAKACARECATGCPQACVASNTAFQPCIVNVPALGNRSSHACIVREDGASRVQMKTDGLSATFLRTTVEAGEVGKLRLAAGSKHVHVSGQGWKAQAERVEVRHGGQVVLCGNVKLESEHLGVAASLRAESLTVQLRQGRFEKVCRQAE